MSDFQALWQDAGWRSRANEWTRHALAEKNIRVESELQETQVRPWSLVLHVATDSGKIFFKAAPPTSAYEVYLTERLAQWSPDSIPQVLAVERALGWWLARDGGENIRAQLKATRDLSEWCEAIALYAQLQMDVAAHIDGMLAFGTPDRRPHTLPAQFQQLLQDRAILRIDQEKGTTSDEYAQLQKLIPSVQTWCAQLAQFNLPASIHHGDLNTGNVLKRDGRYRFVDWGDASVAHPFSSLRTVLVSIEIALDLPDYDPFTQPVRDAYLNAWTKYDSVENVRAAFRLAQHTSSLVSALSWYHAILNFSDERRDEYAHIVPALLQEFLYVDFEKYPFV